MLGPVSNLQSDHIRPTAQIAPDVILPGDPGRALALAQSLLESPLMSNHNRGLWGYSGRRPTGETLTIQASGIGGPSLAVVAEELAQHGARRIVRLGTCRALDPSLRLGEVLIVGAAAAEEGASRALGAERFAEPDPTLHAALVAVAGGRAREATVVSTDLAYGLPEPDGGGAEALAADLGTATLFAWGRGKGLAVAAGLVVTVVGGERLGDERLEGVSLELGEAMATALARSPQPSEAPGSETGAPA